nr:hypothetical protein [Streptomyces albospinus]
MSPPCNPAPVAPQPHHATPRHATTGRLLRTLVLNGRPARPHRPSRPTRPPHGRTSLDIDRVVPPSEAWRSGAAPWTTARRRGFADDLTHAQPIAVADSVNQAAGDGDPAEEAALKKILAGC